MQVFKDNANRDWTLSLNIGTAMMVKDRLGIDILQPDVGDPPLLTRLGTDEMLLAQEMDAGIGGSMRRMWSVVEGVAIAIGGALAPSLKKLTDWWVKAASGVIAYIDKNRELIVQAAKYISILIGVGAALFTLGLGFLAVGKVIGIIAMSIAGMGRVVLSVFGLIDGILNIIRFAVGSFVSVFDGIASSIGSVFSVITPVIRGVFSFFATITSIAVMVMGTIAHVVIGTIIAIVRYLFLIARTVTAVVTVLAPIITTVITALATALVTCISFIISGWKRAEQAIAQGIGWIMAKIEGLDPNEMANMINEDYNRQAQQRESERTQRLNEIEQNRNQKTASIQSEKEGTLANLNTDFENAAKVRYLEHEAKIAAQEQELAKARAAYQDAINRTKNPPPTPEGTEPESLTDKLKQKVNEFASGLNLGDKVSVTGSFSAAAMQSMGISSTMDRVAKATEKSEKHLEKLVNKDANPDKQNVQKKAEPGKADEENDPTVKELKHHTRFLRDISERGLSSKFS